MAKTPTNGVSDVFIYPGAIDEAVLTVTLSEEESKARIERGI